MTQNEYQSSIFTKLHKKLALGVLGDAVLITVAGIILAHKTSRQAWSEFTPGSTSYTNGWIIQATAMFDKLRTMLNSLARSKVFLLRRPQ